MSEVVQLPVPATWEDLLLTIETTQLVPGKLYALESAQAADGPWTTALADITIPQHIRAKISLPDATAPFYRLIAAP